MAGPKAKSVGIVLNRKKNSATTFLLRVPKINNIADGATIKIEGTAENSAVNYLWSGTVANVANQIKEPHKNPNHPAFTDKVLVVQVTCDVGDEIEKAGKAGKSKKGARPKDAGDVIVIDVTLENPDPSAGNPLEFSDIAGLIP